MSNVGWSPSGPTPQPGAVVVDNGDGTGTITNPDGAVINFCTECLNDTDTFATYDKVTNTLTTAAGDVIPLGDNDTTYTITNGNLVGSDGTSVPVGVAAVTPYSQSRANTTAEVAAGAGTPVAFGSTDFLTTNKAVEPSAPGVRNTNGDMGYKVLNITGDYNGDGSGNGATIDPVDNGSRYGVSSTLTTDPAVTLESGKYTGQVVHLHCATGTVARVIMAISGNDLRLGNNTSYVNSSITTPIEVCMRRLEWMTIVWTGGVWRVVTWDKLMYSGNYWKELVNGTELWGRHNLDALDINQEVPLPITLDGNITIANSHVSLTDAMATRQLDGTVYSAAAAAQTSSSMVWAVSDANDDSAFIVVATDNGGDSAAPSWITWKMTTTRRPL